MPIKTKDKLHLDCCGGTRQSPIDLTSPIVAKLPPIEFSYQPMPIEFSKSQRTLQIDAQQGGVRIESTWYKLLQFHFHTPSEHLIDGEVFPMEMHLVHQREDGVLAIVGAFIKEGQTNDEMQKIWNLMPRREEKIPDLNATTNPMNLLPKGQDYYRYNGSLTTPPFSEPVLWFVLNEAIELSADQISHFRKAFKNNARSVQPKGDRLLLQSDPK